MATQWFLEIHLPENVTSKFDSCLCPNEYVVDFGETKYPDGILMLHHHLEKLLPEMTLILIFFVSVYGYEKSISHVKIFAFANKEDIFPKYV